MQFDLEVDTGWIRRAAATLEEVAHAFRPTTGTIGATAVGDGSLGSSAESGTVVRLVNLRCAAAYDAAAQLNSISNGLAGKLRIAADQLDRSEAAAQPGHR